MKIDTANPPALGIRSTAADERKLQQLIDDVAAAFGVPVAALSGGATGKTRGGGMPRGMMARYAVLHLASEHGPWKPYGVCKAMRVTHQGTVAHAVYIERMLALLKDEPPLAARIADLRRTLTAPRTPPRRLAPPPSSQAEKFELEKFGPRNVTRARLRRDRKAGWSIPGLARQWGLAEGQVRNILGEARELSL